MSDDDPVEREFDSLFAQFSTVARPEALSTAVVPPVVVKREPTLRRTASRRRPVDHGDDDNDNDDDSSQVNDATHRRRKALDAADDDFNNNHHGDDNDDDDDDSISESELKAAIEADEAEEAALDAELDDDDDDVDDLNRRRVRALPRAAIDDDDELERLRATHRKMQLSAPARVAEVGSSSGGGRAPRESGGRRCNFPGCSKWGQGRKTAEGYRCVRHGGGQRCLMPGCTMINHGGGYCTQHGGGRRLAGGVPRGLKSSSSAPDVYRETFLKTNDVLQARKVALSTAPVAAASAPVRTAVRAPKAPLPTPAVNPVYLRPRANAVRPTVGKKARQSARGKKSAPTRGDTTETTVVYNAARYAARGGLSRFVGGGAVADDSPDEFAAAAAYRHLASLPGAAPSFAVTPLVAAPYGSRAAYERLTRLDASGSGATLPLSVWWKHRREIIKLLKSGLNSGVVVAQRFLARNVRKATAAAAPPRRSSPRRSSPRRSPSRVSSVKPSVPTPAARDIGSDGASIEELVAPPPVDVSSLFLPDVVEPKPGFLDSLTPRPKRAAAAASAAPASVSPAAKRKRTGAGATPSNAAAEREKALFAKVEGGKRTRASATATETPQRASEAALLSTATSTQRSTRSNKTKEFFHLPTGGWFDNRMAEDEQKQATTGTTAASNNQPPVDDGIGQDEFA